MLRMFVFAAATLAVTGCSLLTEPEVTALDGVELRTDRDSYTQSDTIQVRFINNSTQPVGYGACSRSLERRTHEGWKPFANYEGPCILILYVLNPGQTKIDRASIDPGLPAGIYRFRERALPGTNLPERSIVSPAWTLHGDH